MAYIEINYKCKKCGYEDSMSVETYYLWDPIRCPECDIPMVEVSREQELEEEEDEQIS